MTKIDAILATDKRYAGLDSPNASDWNKADENLTCDKSRNAAIAIVARRLVEAVEELGFNMLSDTHHKAVEEALCAYRELTEMK